MKAPAESQGPRRARRGAKKGPEKPTMPDSAPGKTQPELEAEARRERLARLTFASEDPEQVRAAVSDAASTAGALWIAFIGFGTYLTIAVGSVTHRQLFLDQPLRLPFLDVELPMLAFFWVAPALFLILHLYLLLQLRLMSDRTRRYEELVSAPELSEGVRDRVRWQLPNFLFVQMAAAPKAERRGLIGQLFHLIAWVTVVGGPVGLLLLIQLQFLPFHSGWVTWVDRMAIAADLALLWLFWPAIAGSPKARPMHRLRLVMCSLGSVSVLLVSVLFATIPGEALDQNPLAAAK